MTARLSTKGQIVLPKELRDARDWKPGTEFEVIEQPDGVLLRPKTAKKRYTIDDLIGCLPYDGPPKTLEEMDRGIEQAVRERWERKSRGSDT